MVENRKTTSGQVSHFHRHHESNKTVTVSPEKTCNDVNLSVTTKNTAAIPLNFPEVGKIAGT